jgi:transmembrane sensor
MSKPLTDRIVKARELVQVSWTDDRARAVERAFFLRRRRRRAVRGAVSVGLLFLVGAGVAVGLLRNTRDPGRRPATVSAAAAPAPLRLDDGSRAIPLDASSTVEVVTFGPERAELRLLGGSARFEVIPNRARLFRVQAGHVTVTVKGTIFVVARERGQVAVTVEEGVVEVRSSTGIALLARGQSGRYEDAPPSAEPIETDAGLAPEPPTAQVAPPVTPAVPSVQGSRSKVALGESAPARRTRPRDPRPEGPDWKTLAQRGDFDGAHAALAKQGPPRDDPADLLLAADVARLTRHPAEAVSLLRRVVDRHGQDPRAPLAAFTLGRVLLEELGRPQEAAAAFAQARRLGPSGPLAEDALAREVEAWSRAGVLDRARERATEYLQRYPGGARIRSVRRHAGLD